MEVHAVISQYMIECMDSNEVFILAPACENLNAVYSVAEGLTLTFQQAYGEQDPSSLTVVDYLKYRLSEIENNMLPVFLKTVNMFTVIEPHVIMLMLQQIKDLMKWTYNINLASLLGEQINVLKNNSNEILKDTHKLCKKLNQRIQRNLFEKNYDDLIETVEEFIKTYPLCSVAQKAVDIVEKIIPYCDSNVLHHVIVGCEYLQMRTCDYHHITTSVLHHIRLQIKLHKQITGSLLNGSPDIELTYHYIMSGKFDEEVELVDTNRLIKLQEVAPNYVQQQLSQQ